MRFRAAGVGEVSNGFSGRLLPALLLLLLPAVAGAGCGGAGPMGTLSQGVDGPISTRYSVDDLTRLSTVHDTIYSFSRELYVQAVVNSVHTGDTVSASMASASLTQPQVVSFTADQDSDVGLLFHFTGPWPAGNYTVTVTHGSTSVGATSYPVMK